MDVKHSTALDRLTYIDVDIDANKSKGHVRVYRTICRTSTDGLTTEGLDEDVLGCDPRSPESSSSCPRLSHMRSSRGQFSYAQNHSLDHLSAHSVTLGFVSSRMNVG